MACNSLSTLSFKFLMQSISYTFTATALGSPSDQPSVLPLQMVMLIFAPHSHSPWLLPEITNLEKLLLHLIRWVLSLRQRKLMTTTTLLTSISPDCRSWHLKLRLAKRAHCLFDLHSLSLQSGWEPYGEDHRVAVPSLPPHAK